MNKTIFIISILVGIVLIVLSVLYYPAKTLLAKMTVRRIGKAVRRNIVFDFLRRARIKWVRIIVLLVGVSILSGAILGYYLRGKLTGYIHNRKTSENVYRIILADLTWYEAYEACLNNKSNLIRLESDDEYEYITRSLTDKGLKQYMFFVGAMRNPNQEEYYWTDENNQLIIDECMNDLPYWAEGEPSFYDANLGIEERFTCLYFSKQENRWVINDIPNNLLDALPYYKGRVGYIQESEQN